MRSEMAPGAAFPDYELSDHTAKRRKLSELQGQDPMIVVLSPRRLLSEGSPAG
jgi:peroxiredoxin